MDSTRARNDEILAQPNTPKTFGGRTAVHPTEDHNHVGLNTVQKWVSKQVYPSIYTPVYRGDLSGEVPTKTEALAKTGQPHLFLGRPY